MSRRISFVAIGLIAAVFTGPMFADTVVVGVGPFDFTPADIVIKPGDTVQWVRTSGSHTVTEGTDGTQDGDELFDADITPATPTFEFTFDGFDDVVVDFFCAIHFAFGMTGTVTVLPAASGDEHVVTVEALDFNPKDIIINAGETVRWEWTTGEHTVTEGTDGSHDGDELFHSDLNETVSAFEFTFTEPDVVVDYFCEIHFGFGMTGTVTVLPKAVPCEGDANGDGVVDPLDFGFVLARFGCDVAGGAPDCVAADQNHDGLVDPLDAGFVLARFGDCP